LAAAKLDVKLRAVFPSLGFQRELGIMHSKPLFVLKSASLLYSLGGGTINGNAIKPSSVVMQRQIQAMYNYERVLLNAYLEVSNQLSKLIT
jgi:outer membrane protein TolC